MTQQNHAAYMPQMLMLCEAKKRFGQDGTVIYPERKREMEGFKMSVLVDQEKCNRDGICVAECPTHVLEIIEDGDFPTPTVDFSGTCLKCGPCVAACPTGAVSLDWLAPDECPSIRGDLELSPEQAEQFLRSRRSVRIFKDDPIPREKLEKLIQIACYAPSAKNYQP
jgi:ferredoxin